MLVPPLLVKSQKKEEVAKARRPSLSRWNVGPRHVLDILADQEAKPLKKMALASGIEPLSLP
jgi:hypothetical protein